MGDSPANDGSVLYCKLKDVAQNHPGKIAIICGSRAISYADLLKKSGVFRDALSRQADDTVFGLLISDPINFMIAYFGLAAAGRKIVLLDPRNSAEEIAIHATDLCVASILTSKNEALYHSDRSDFQIEIDGIVFCVSSLANERSSYHSQYIADDFVVHCTSGSTGRPKGIVLSENNVIARVTSWCNTLAITSQDVLLCSLTLAHCHGIEIIMLPGILSGGTVVAPELAGLTPRKIAGLIREHHVTIFSTLPFMYDLLIEAMDPEDVNFGNVRLFVAASAPLHLNTASSFRQKFGHHIHQAYGLSEIGGICFNRSVDEPDLIGEKADGLELRLEPLADADQGQELVVRGPGLARGYVNADDREMFHDGWLWTKDIVERTEGGFRVLGRVSSFINSGGNKIVPREIEDQIRQCQSVVDVVVVGEPDPLEGEIVVAFVQWRDGPNPAEVRTRLTANLAGYKLPREIVTVAEMPRGNIGKVSRGLLNLRLSSRASGKDGQGMPS